MAMQARTAMISVVAASLCLSGCAPETATAPNEGVTEVANEAAVINPTVEDWSPQDANMSFESGHGIFIDVRTAEEVAEGIIPGAQHIPLDEFDPSKIEISPYDHVILYCRSGRRSRIAAEQLSAYTGEPVAHLEGGINAWKESGKPVEAP